MNTPSRPAPQTRSDYRAFVPVTTRWSDNDMYGHMNNAAYYAFFDTAVTTWLIGTGGSAEPTGSMFFVAETGCRYLSEIGYPDEVTVGLRIGHLGTSSIRYEIALFRNDAQMAAAEGLFVHVHVDRQTRRPAPIPAEMRAVFEGIMR